MSYRNDNLIDAHEIMLRINVMFVDVIQNEQDFYQLMLVFVIKITVVFVRLRFVSSNYDNPPKSKK